MTWGQLNIFKMSNNYPISWILAYLFAYSYHCSQSFYSSTTLLCCMFIRYFFSSNISYHSHLLITKEQVSRFEQMHPIVVLFCLLPGMIFPLLLIDPTSHQFIGFTEITMENRLLTFNCSCSSFYLQTHPITPQPCRTPSWWRTLTVFLSGRGHWT